MPPGAQAALRRGRRGVDRYPDGGATELRRAIGARFGLDPGADRLRRRVGRADLPALPGLWRAGPRALMTRARVHHLRDRRQLRRLPGDQDAGARHDGGRGRAARRGLAGDPAGVPGQPEQPHRHAAAASRGGAAARRPAARGAAGARRGLRRIRRRARTTTPASSWSMPATTR